MQTNGHTLLQHLSQAANLLCSVVKSHTITLKYFKIPYFKILFDGKDTILPLNTQIMGGING